MDAKQFYELKFKKKTRFARTINDELGQRKLA